MGIGGHILGERKLRALNRRTGMNFDRAYNRNGYCEGRTITLGRCRHYIVDLDTNEVRECDERTIHWASCPRTGRQ